VAFLRVDVTAGVLRASGIWGDGGALARLLPGDWVWSVVVFFGTQG